MTVTRTIKTKKRYEGEAYLEAFYANTVLRDKEIGPCFVRSITIENEHSDKTVWYTVVLEQVDKETPCT